MGYRREYGDDTMRPMQTIPQDGRIPRRRDVWPGGH